TGRSCSGLPSGHRTAGWWPPSAPGSPGSDDGWMPVRGPITVALALLAGGACGRPLAVERVGPQADGTGLTPNHWLLTPAGRQVEVGDRPLGLYLTPDGRHLLVSNNGQGVQSLAVVETASRAVVQTLPYPSPEALFLGVVTRRAGRPAYASSGGNNSIRVYDLAEGRLRERDPIPLGARGARVYPAGLALSADGQTLYAALNLAGAVAVVDLRARTERVRIPLPWGGRPD